MCQANLTLLEVGVDSIDRNVMLFYILILIVILLYPPQRNSGRNNTCDVTLTSHQEELNNKQEEGSLDGLVTTNQNNMQVLEEHLVHCIVRDCSAIDLSLAV